MFNFIQLQLGCCKCRLAPTQSGSEADLPACQRSSVVEQLFRKQPVVGSIPTVGSFHLIKEMLKSKKEYGDYLGKN